MEELKLKLTELKTLLMNRGNNAYTFFEKILKQIDDNNNEFIDLSRAIIEKLKHNANNESRVAQLQGGSVVFIHYKTLQNYSAKI